MRQRKSAKPSKPVSSRCSRASRGRWISSPNIWRSSELPLGVAIGGAGRLGPAPPYGRYEFLLVLLHFPDKRCVAGIFVPGSPQHHFREDWRQIETLGRERVNQLAAVRRVAIGGDDSMSDQLLQPIRQNVRRDSLVGSQELFIRTESPQHHVADNQQRPAIAQNLHRGIQRTPRPPLEARLLPGHVLTLAYFHLHFASYLLQTDFPKPAILGCKLKWEYGNEPSNNEEIACDAIGSAPDGERQGAANCRTTRALHIGNNEKRP